MAKHKEPTRAVHRYEVPFGVQGLPLANPDLGIGKMLTRPQPHSYNAEVTVIDAPDHRLVRAGVLLAHRVMDGVGEWYLSAPAWAPIMPAEEIEHMGTEDIPERFGNLIMPFRRRATLAPVAAIRYRRVEFLINGADDRRLGTIRDERVTVRRGGLTTSRFRQVTLTQIDAEPDQLAAIDDALQVVGGIRLKEFPSLRERLGSPATGLSDFPPPRDWKPDEPLEAFVGALLGAHLHALMGADLVVRAGEAPDVSGVTEALETLARDLRGLAGILDRAWSNDVLADIDWVLTRPDDTPVQVRFGERYLGIVDRLVRAARAPRVGTLALKSAGAVVAQKSREATAALAVAADRLHPDSADVEWGHLIALSHEAAAIAGVAEHLYGKRAKRLRRRLEKIGQSVHAATASPALPAPHELAAMSGAQAFDAGRAHERAALAEQLARVQFCATWKHERRKLKGGEVRS